jgi:hypothetical protein
MARLVFKYEPDPDDCVGRLYVQVESNSFSGRGFFWAQPEQIERFALEAGGYPLLPKHPARIRLGYNELKDADVIVAVEISPADGVGNIAVRVELADLYETAERVRTRFQTNYPDLERFVDDLLGVMNGVAEEAVLVGR